MEMARPKDTQKEVNVSSPALRLRLVLSVEFLGPRPCSADGGGGATKSLPFTPEKEVTETVRISLRMEPMPTRHRRK